MNDKQIVLRAAAIQRYLLARPESADTLESVHTSWIRPRDPDDSMDLTQAALEYLEAAGVVESIEAGPRRVWRRAAIDAESSATPASMNIACDQRRPDKQ
jgi:hypothetical protein